MHALSTHLMPDALSASLFVCSRCSRPNPPSQFQVLRRNGTTRSSKRCQSCREDDRRWRAKNPDYGANWRRAHPEYFPEWSAKNPGYQAEWGRSNRDATAKSYQDRAARKRDAWVEDVDRRIVFHRDEGICGICHLEVDPLVWHLDHITPITRGGLHCYRNTRVAHPLCNQWKRNRLDEELPPIPNYVLTAARKTAA